MITWLLAHAEDILCGAFLTFLASYALTNLPEIRHELLRTAAVEVAHTTDLYAEFADLVLAAMTKAHLALERVSEPVEQTAPTAMRVMALRRRVLDVVR